MANFKTHLSTGFILGITCTILILLYGISHHWTIFLLIIFSISIGSFLPDIDSDSSIPFRIVFYTLSIISAFFIFLWTLHNYPNQPLLITTIPIITFLIVRFIFGWIFKRFTHHRGIFHSVPMALIATSSTFLLLQKFTHLTTNEHFLLSIGLGIGFVSHLILDEIYAATNFNGKKFHPNKSLGSSLKLWSSSFPITLITYFFLFILLKMCFF